MTSFLDPASQVDGQTNTTNTDSTTTPNNDPVVLEWNGRKYTQADLVNKLSHADSFIEQLKREKAEEQRRAAELEAKVNKTLTAEELLKQLQTKAVPTSTPEPTSSPEPISEDRIEQLVTRALQNNVNKQKQDENWTKVRATLTSTYGNKTDEVVSKVAAQHNLSMDEAATFARNNPSVFLALFPETSAKPTPKPNSIPSYGSVNIPQSNTDSVITGKAYFSTRTNRERVDLYLKALEEISSRG